VKRSTFLCHSKTKEIVKPEHHIKTFTKEDGRCRYKKFHWYNMFITLYEDGWLKTTKANSVVHPTIKPHRPS